MAIEANELEIFDMGKRINIEPELLEKPQLAGIKDDGFKS